jgi:hypothetical protein
MQFEVVICGKSRSNFATNESAARTFYIRVCRLFKDTMIKLLADGEVVAQYVPINKSSSQLWGDAGQA